MRAQSYAKVSTVELQDEAPAGGPEVEMEEARDFEMEEPRVSEVNAVSARS